MLGETIGTVQLTTASNSAYLITHTRTLNEGGSPITITGNLHTTIFHIHLISSSTASVINIYDGSSATVPKIQVTGTISKGIDFDFGIWGIDFTNGAYVVTDANIIGASIVCKANDF